MCNAISAGTVIKKFKNVATSSSTMQLHDMHPASASTFTTAYTEVYGLFHVTSEDAIVQYVYYVLFGATLGQPLITETLHFSPFYFSP